MAEIKTQKNTREFRSTPYANIDTNAGKYTRRTAQMLSSGLSQLGTALEGMDEEAGKIEAARLQANMKNDVSALLIEAEGTAKNGTINTATLAKKGNFSKELDLTALNGQTVQDAVTNIHMQYDGRATNLSETGHKFFSNNTIDTRASDDIRAHVLYRGLKTKGMQVEAARTYNDSTVGIAGAKDPIRAGGSSEVSAETTHFNFQDNSYITPLANDKLRDSTYTQITIASLDGAMQRENHSGVLDQMGVSSDVIKTLTPEEQEKWGVFWDAKTNQVKDKAGTVIAPNTIDVVASAPKLKGVKLLKPEMRARIIKSALAGMATKARKDSSANEAAAKDAIDSNWRGVKTEAAFEKDKQAVAKVLRDPNKPEAQRVAIAVELVMAKAFSGTAAQIPLAPVTTVKDGPKSIEDMRKELVSSLDNLDNKALFGDKLGNVGFSQYVDSKSFMADAKVKVLRRFDARVAQDLADRKADPAAYIFKNDQGMSRMFKQTSVLSGRINKVLSEEASLRDEGGVLSQAQRNSLNGQRESLASISKMYVAEMDTMYDTNQTPIAERSYIPKSMVKAGMAHLQYAMDRGDKAGTMQAFNHISSMVGLGAKGVDPALKNDWLRTSEAPLGVHTAMRINDPKARAEMLNLLAGKKILFKEIGDSKLKGKLNDYVHSNSLVNNTVDALINSSNIKDGVYLSAMVKDAVGTMALRDITDIGSVKNAVSEAAKYIIPKILTTHRTLGITGQYAITTDAVANIDMDADSIATGMGVLKTKLREVKPASFSAKTLDLQAQLKRGDVNAKWKDLSDKEQDTSIRMLRLDLEPTMLTDGTTQIIRRSNNEVIPVFLDGMRSRSYNISPDLFKDLSTAKEREAHTADYIRKNITTPIRGRSQGRGY